MAPGPSPRLVGDSGLSSFLQGEEKRGASDAFAQLQAALGTLGVEAAEQEALWRVLAGIYHLGAAGVCKGTARKRWQGAPWGSPLRNLRWPPPLALPVSSLGCCPGQLQRPRRCESAWRVASTSWARLVKRPLASLEPAGRGRAAKADGRRVQGLPGLSQKAVWLLGPQLAREIPSTRSPWPEPFPGQGGGRRPGQGCVLGEGAVFFPKGLETGSSALLDSFGRL